MTHDLFSSLDSFKSLPGVALMVQDPAGEYRPADAEEVLHAAQRVLASQVRGTDVLNSPAMVRSFLQARMSQLPHEIFAVIHLDTQCKVIDYVEMFRGTLSQTSVYPREIARDALLKGSSAVILCHNHPSGLAEPSRADELLTSRLKEALGMLDIRVLDHLIVAGSTVASFAERGLL